MIKPSIKNRDSNLAVISFASAGKAVITKEEAKQLGFQPTGNIEVVNLAFDKKTQQTIKINEERAYAEYA